MLSARFPIITEAVREYNASVVEAGGSYAVPILPFLRNSAGFDLTQVASQVTAEPLVPVV